MQSKKISVILLSFIFLVGLTLFVSILYYPQKLHSGWSALSLTRKDTTVKEIQPSFGLPQRLKIPVINVDAAIESVGVNSKGAMDVPKNPANVAWFEPGKRPGEVGSAVMAGHYGIWETGEGSVFDSLKKMVQGDKIYVENDKGETIIFMVRESLRFDSDADASGIFASNDGKSHLNLITCENWDEASKSYTRRLVVFADKE